jgi:hypothetical protein
MTLHLVIDVKQPEINNVDFSFLLLLPEHKPWAGYILPSCPSTFKKKYYSGSFNLLTSPINLPVHLVIDSTTGNHNVDFSFLLRTQASGRIYSPFVPIHLKKSII